ncbi:MAG: NifU family protein [Bacilli bacterium]|nr:NifU family protein [Bacilli bacterium]
MEEKIKSIIEELRPYLNMDGGDIEFVKYEDHYVYVKLKGHCVDCLGQDFTLKNYILNMLQSEVEEIEGVINVDL